MLLVKDLEKLQIEVIASGGRIPLPALQATSTIVEKIKAGQLSDSECVKIRQKIEEGATVDFVIQDGIVKFKNRLYVPNQSELKTEILEAAHNSLFSTHPGSTKMYQDLKTHYRWSGMKKDIADYVARCPVCQQIKTEHQKPGGLLQPLRIPVWKMGADYDGFCGGPTSNAKTSRRHMGDCRPTH